MSRFIDEIRFRPTGYMRPGEPPDVLLIEAPEEAKVVGESEWGVPEYEARLVLAVRFYVPHPDAQRHSMKDAEEKLVNLILRDYYEQAVKLPRALWELEQEILPHLVVGSAAHTALNRLRNDVTDLLSALNPVNNLR